MKALKTGSYRMLEELRAVKTPSEVAIMEECSRLTTDIYDALLNVSMEDSVKSMWERS